MDCPPKKWLLQRNGHQWSFGCILLLPAQLYGFYVHFQRVFRSSVLLRLLSLYLNPESNTCWQSTCASSFVGELACENICFSSLFAAGDVSRGGTSVTQRQKFHNDDANQCLLNNSGSRGVPNVNLFNFRMLVKCCVHLRTSSSKTQMLVVEKTIFHKY